MGFHGHNRAKSRIEFSNFYRQLAKPPPPRKFVTRQNSDVLRHTFSHHDNRQAYLNDPLLFGEGFGKKKIESVNKSKWKPDFISWQDSNLNLMRSQMNRSIYQRDFASSQELSTMAAAATAPPSRSGACTSRLLTGREAFDNNALSVYKLNYSHGEPNPAHSREIQEETYYRFINKNRAKSCMTDDARRTTVANCLVWNDQRHHQRAPTSLAIQTNQQSSQAATQQQPQPQAQQSQQPPKRELTFFAPPSSEHSVHSVDN